MDIAACKMYVKGRTLAFDVGEHHVEFGLFKDHESSSLSLPGCGYDLVISSEIVELFDVSPNDPHEFDYVSTDNHGLGYCAVDLVNDLPPSIVKDKPYDFSEGYLCDYHRFA